MAKPQRENGHVDIANELIEALAKIRISGEEWQCLLVIIRKTYGWQKKSDFISLSQFAVMTSINRSNVCRALKRLLSKKIIYVVKKDTSSITKYSVNKDFDEWNPLSKKTQGVSKKIRGGVFFDNQGVSIKTHTIDTTTIDTTTKEKKKEKKKLIFPDCVDKSLIEKYIQNRIEIKNKMTHHAKELFLLKIEKFQKKGQNIKDLIEKAIIGGWSDIYEQKGNRNEKLQNDRTNKRKPVEQAQTKAESKGSDRKRIPTKITIEN